MPAVHRRPRRSSASVGRGSRRRGRSWSARRTTHRSRRPRDRRRRSRQPARGLPAPAPPLRRQAPCRQSASTRGRSSRREGSRDWCGTDDAPPDQSAARAGFEHRQAGERIAADHADQDHWHRAGLHHAAFRPRNRQSPGRHFVGPGPPVFEAAACAAATPFTTQSVVSALADRSSGFRIVLRPRLPVSELTVASCGLRPRSQRRVHAGLSPASLEALAGISKRADDRRDPLWAQAPRLVAVGPDRRAPTPRPPRIYSSR